MTISTMPRHPIRVVAQRTGLTTATLRAWERRYHVVSPERSEGGQRLYSDQDVHRLKRLRLLTEAGRSISSVAALPDAEAEALLEEDLASPSPSRFSEHPASQQAGDIVEEALRLVHDLDGNGLERVLRRAAVTLGGLPFLEHVVGPLLHEVGVAWTRGDMPAAHEHLCSAVVTGVLTWLAEPTVTKADAPRLIVTTLPGERHGLGAMLVAAAAGMEGWLVTYLGTDLPASDIARAAVTTGAEAVALSVVHVDDPARTAWDLTALRNALPPDAALLIGGAGVSRIPRGTVLSGVHVVPGLGELRDLLGELT
jgi:DNA-binding transcriptional MerR regulator/methylmalonyl-CoA mutase cobalamin-binding subunit